MTQTPTPAAAERLAIIWKAEDEPAGWRREQLLDWQKFIRKNWPALAEAIDALAPHRTPAEAEMDDDIRLPRMPLSTQKVTVTTDPAQAHAAELETALGEMISVAEEHDCDAGPRTQYARALLATLERERQAQKGGTP